MAEAFGKAIVKNLNKDIEVYSAGSFPAGFVHPLAIKVMKEKGLDISEYLSKSLKEIPYDNLDYAITLCDHAKEMCPVAPKAKMIHWGLPDPAGAIGDEEEKMKSFRKSREDIEKRVRKLMEEI